MRVVVALLLLSASLCTAQHVFEPIRKVLAEIDGQIRSQDAADRKDVDSQIAIVATKLGKSENALEAFLAKYDAMRRDVDNLKTKADLSSVVLGALKQEKTMLEKEQAALKAECTALSDELGTLDGEQQQRQHQLEGIQQQLKNTHSKGDALREEEEGTKQFEQAMQITNLIQDDAVSDAAQADLRSQQLTKLQTEITAMTHALEQQQQQHATATTEMCAVHTGVLASRIEEINERVDNVTHTASEWRQIADEKNRRLLASDPLIQQQRAGIARSTKAIETTANAYQARRNSRLHQLCETVSLRRLLSPEDSDTPILAAVLPGPSHYPSATIEAIIDSELNCSQPLHTASTPIGGVEPAGHGQLSLNGQRPLTDEWAGKAQLDKPCTSQTRVVDADVVE